MQRLFAQAVARQKQRLPSLVVQGDGKHSSQPFHAIRPHLLIQVDDDLSVAVRIEAVTAGFQFSAKLRKVVNLAVENNPDALVFIVDGLPPAGEVNDAKPTDPKPYWAPRVNPLVVRTAMNDSLAHPTDLVGINEFVLPSNHSGYSAHHFTSDVFTTSKGSASAGIPALQSP